jgi:hypothetical protein
MTARLIFTAFFLTGLLLSGCREASIDINVEYDNLSGLVKDDRVLFNGNEAGRVHDIHYREDGTYSVRLSIDQGFARALTEFSTFHVIDEPAGDGRKAIDLRVSRQGGEPLKSGATVKGARSFGDLIDRVQKDIESGFEFFKERLKELERDVQEVPESEAYKDLKDSLEALAGEIRKKEREARDKIKREWLPRIEQELEALRRRLEKLGREKELEPLEVEVERIRRL